MANLAQLSNTARFYWDRAQEVEDAFKAGKHQECYDLCHLWLSKANLPLYFRATFTLLLTTGGSDDEKVRYAQQALKHFDKILEQEPGHPVAIQYKALAFNTLKKANALKALHEKEAAERRNERTDEEVVSWLLERAAIECGLRSPEDSFREIKLALAHGQSPGMGVNIDPDGTRSVRVNTLKTEERAAIKEKGNFAGPKPVGSGRLMQYGKQKPKQSVVDKHWLELKEGEKADLARSTEKTKQEAINNLAKGFGASYTYEEDGGRMAKQPPPSDMETEGVLRIKKEPVSVGTFGRNLTRLSNTGERFGFSSGKSDAAGESLMTLAESQSGDQSMRHEFSTPSSAVQTLRELILVDSQRTPMQRDCFNMPLSRTPLVHRRKKPEPSEGTTKKRVADDDEDGYGMGARIKRVKSKESQKG